MGIPCATAPATLAGTLVSMNAEMLGGMTIVEEPIRTDRYFVGTYTDRIRNRIRKRRRRRYGRDLADLAQEHLPILQVVPKLFQD